MSNLQLSYQKTFDEQQRRAACVDAVIEVIAAQAQGGNPGVTDMLMDIDAYVDKVQEAIGPKTPVTRQAGTW